MPFLLPSFLVVQGRLVGIENKQRKRRDRQGRGAVRRELLQAFEVRGVSVVRAESFEGETKSGCSGQF